MAARISLEQWRALIAVVEADGYAAAAGRLHKSQSTVSYAIARIEELLGVELFEIQGRKARVTAAGQLLYRRARALVEQAERMERAASELAGGVETQLHLAVEIIFPTWKLLECLGRLCSEYPRVSVQLHESVLGQTGELLTSGRVALAIGSSIPPGYLGDVLTRVRFLAAAAPGHPLHHLGRPVTADDLREHRHLLVRDPASEPMPAASWEGGEPRWTVSNKATSIRAACMGLGYAWYPEEMIRGELESGALAALPLAHGTEHIATLYLIHADPEAPGPVAARMAEILFESVRNGTSAG